MKLLYEKKEQYVFRYTRSLDFAPHLHDAMEIVVLVKGRGMFLDGNAWTELSAGDVFVSFPNRIHGYKNCRDLELYLLILPTKSCLGAYHSVVTEKTPAQAYMKKGQWEQSGILQLLAVALADKEQATPAIMEGYFQVIVGKLLAMLTLQDAGREGEDALQLILRYISEHYTEKLTRSALAKAVGYNESYISHLLAQTLKTTLPEYIHNLQMQDACRWLRQTSVSVTQIAMDLGFGSLRNFNRVFLKKTGMTPRQYRYQSQVEK